MQQLIKTGLFFLFLLPGLLLAQVKTPYLEKKVNLNVRNQSLAEVFTLIEKQTGVIFSYNPKQVNDQKKVTVRYIKTPLRLVMEDLVKSAGCKYKIKNNYIILFGEAKKNAEPSAISLLSGYIYNSADGSVLENASIYIPSGKYAAVSDQFGFFSISCSKTSTRAGTDGKPLLHLAVAKENFNDTLFMIPEPGTESVKLFLSPKDLPVKSTPVVVIDSAAPVMPDTIAPPPVAADTSSPAPEKRLSFWPNINKMKVNLKNIKDTFLNSFSFSLVPPISTNKLLSFNTVNKFSLNLLVGYSKGVRLLEIGGLVNVDDGDVRYAQVGGLGNSVSGSVTGGQVGGLYSITKKNTRGAQVGGLYASTGGKVDGAQIGGLIGIADTVRGAQIGGLYGSAKNVSGTQIGGLIALVDTIRGFQLGGLVSRAKYMSGTQISGLVNYAKTMKGFQLSFINIAHDAKGIPFGIFTFVKNGYHKIEISANEMQMVNLGFRSGVERLHNIVFAGMGIDSKSWTYGYGLGASFRLNEKWGISTDLSAQQVNPVGGAQQYINLVNKLLVAAEFSPAKKIRLAIGPSYNVRVTDARSSTYNTIIPGDLVSYFYDHDEGGGSNINTKMWIGGTLSVKFL